VPTNLVYGASSRTDSCGCLARRGRPRPKASTLVTSTGYDGSLGNCLGGDVEVTPFLTDQALLSAVPAGKVLVVTGFSWEISGATANSRAQVSLHAVGGNSVQTLVTSTAVANSAGLAVGSITLQPGVVFRPATGLAHLCIGRTSISGTLSDEGSLQGYLAPDK
jgi:hypothetical protein